MALVKRLSLLPRWGEAQETGEVGEKRKLEGICFQKLLLWLCQDESPDTRGREATEQESTKSLFNAHLRSV